LRLLAAILAAMSLGLSACNGGSGATASQPDPSVQNQGGGAPVQPAPQAAQQIPDGVPSGTPETAPKPTPSLSPVQSNDPTEIPLENVVWALGSDGNSVEAIQRPKGQVAYTLDLARPAQQVVKTDGALWIVARDGTLSKFDFSTGNLVEILSIEGNVGPIAVSGGHVWVVHKIIESSRGTKRPEILVLDSVAGSLETRIPLGDIADYIGAIEAVGNSVFVLLNDHFGLYRIRTEGMQVSKVNLGLPEGYGLGSLTSVGNTLWVLDHFSSRLVSLNANTLEILASGDVPPGMTTNFAASGSNVYLISRYGHAVLKLDQHGTLIHELQFEDTPRAIVEVSGQIWVSLLNRVVVIDPRTGGVLKSFGHVAVQEFAGSRAGE
jgi:hypothetical protein